MYQQEMEFAKTKLLHITRGTNTCEEQMKLK